MIAEHGLDRSGNITRLCKSIRGLGEIRIHFSLTAHSHGAIGHKCGEFALALFAGGTGRNFSGNGAEIFTFFEAFFDSFHLLFSGSPFFRSCALGHQFLGIIRGHDEDMSHADHFRLLEFFFFIVVVKLLDISIRNFIKSSFEFFIHEGTNGDILDLRLIFQTVINELLQRHFVLSELLLDPVLLFFRQFGEILHQLFLCPGFICFVTGFCGKIKKILFLNNVLNDLAELNIPDILRHLHQDCSGTIHIFQAFDQFCFCDFVRTGFCEDIRQRGEDLFQSGSRFCGGRSGGGSDSRCSILGGHDRCGRKSHCGQQDLGCDVLHIFTFLVFFSLRGSTFCYLDTEYPFSGASSRTTGSPNPSRY